MSFYPPINWPGDEAFGVIDQECIAITNCNRLLKGQRGSKLSRQQLEEKFSSSQVFSELRARVGDRDNEVIRPWFVGDDIRPPSMRSLSALVPIMLNDMCIADVHDSRVAVVRTITEPNFDRYLCAGVEDAKGNVAIIVLHNTDPSLKKEDILPKGLVLAVKEPHYQAFPNGMQGILVENISDLVELDVGSFLMPSTWRQEALSPYSSDPNELKIAGNSALYKKDFIKALRHYTMGISLCKSSEQDLHEHLLRNRSLANISLGRYQQAREDALASIIHGKNGVASSIASELDAKAYFRAACASYQLACFDEAQRYLDKALTLSPGNSAVLRELNKTQARISESQCGEYDFDALIKSIRPGKTHIDAANFVSNTEVKAFEDGRGRGLIATKDLQMGELIMCEKAFCAVFTDEVLDHAHVNLITDMDTNRMFSVSMARLTPMTIQKMLHNGCNAGPVFNFSAPCFPMDIRGSITVDSQTPTNSFFVEHIVKRNGFSLPLLYTANRQISMLHRNLESDMMNFFSYYNGPTSSGIFPHASLTNHACDANAVCSFIGDLIIFRAAKNIKKGEEITMAYRVRTPDMQQNLRIQYGFTCTCAQCKADAQHPDVTLEERGEFVSLMSRQLSEALTLNSSDHPAGRPSREELKRLYTRIKRAYNPSICGNLPCLALIEIDMWRVMQCVDGSRVVDAGQLLYHSLACLRNTGLVVTVDRERQNLSVDASTYVESNYTVDVLVYAAMACKKLGKTALCGELTKLARLLWKIHTGAMARFDEKYANALGM